MAGIDTALNIAVPTILILIVISFVWSKIIDPLLMPHLKKLWEYMNEAGETKHTKEIIYGEFA